MKNQACCFTGHRNIPAEKYPEIQRNLMFKIAELIQEGICHFYTGGAVGFDTMAALAVLKMKKEFPHIRLILVLPCRDQTRGWHEADKKIYGHILQQADKAVYVSENYDEDCMQKRNRYLADSSSVCVCYLTCSKGGTAYTVGYARQKGLRMINLALNGSASRAN